MPVIELNPRPTYGTQLDTRLLTQNVAFYSGLHMIADRYGASISIDYKIETFGGSRYVVAIVDCPENPAVKGLAEQHLQKHWMSFRLKTDLD